MLVFMYIFRDLTPSLDRPFYLSHFVLHTLHCSLRVMKRKSMTRLVECTLACGVRIQYQSSRDEQYEDGNVSEASFLRRLNVSKVIVHTFIIALIALL